MKRIIICLGLIFNLLLFINFRCAATSANVRYEFDKTGEQLCHGTSFVPALDGNGYVVIYYLSTGIPWNLLVKRDSTGNELWGKYIPGSFNFSSMNGDTIIHAEVTPQVVYGCADGSYMLLLFEDTSATIQSLPRVHNKLISFTKFDEAGNYLWTNTNVYDSTYSFGNVAWNKNTSSAWIYQSNYISRYDSLGNFMWQKSFKDSTNLSIQNVFANDNGELFVGAVKSSDSSSFVFELDIDGDVVWSKKITSGQLTGFTSISARSNGEILIAANGPAGTFISTVDTSLTFLQSYLFTDPNFGNSQHSVRLVPLPGKSILTLVDGIHYAYIDSTFSFQFLNTPGYSITTPDYYSYGAPYNTIANGDKVVDFFFDHFQSFHIFSIDHKFALRELLETGAPCSAALSYYYPLMPFQISLSNVQLSDTDLAAPLSALASSLIDSPFLQSQLSSSCFYDFINEDTFKNNAEVRVYPNPTKGKLILECSNAPSEDYYFCVYDYTGRLVIKKRSFSQIEKIEIDLLPFGKGLYLVEFVDKENVILKKVMLE